MVLNEKIEKKLNVPLSQWHFLYAHKCIPKSWVDQLVEKCLLHKKG